MSDFKIDYLDHVGITVKDMEVSAEWYQRVLGLKRYDPPKWNGVPMFLMAGQTGIALFPANTNDPELSPSSQNVKIDHFAFRVDRQNFDAARKKYEALNIEHTFKDHIYYLSLYTNDPDGHLVELTMLNVDAKDFF